MTLKHSKYGTSELLDLVLSTQPVLPVEKVASVEVSYEVTGDLLSDVISLADGLRARGFVAQAEALEEKLFIREAAKKKLEKAQKAEKTVLDEAHPDGDVEVAKSQSGMGKVWTEQSAKQEILKKVLKTPTGKYASMGAAVSLLASKMAIQFGAYLSKAMDRHFPEGGSADDIVDAVEYHLAEVLVEQTRGYPANLVNAVAEEFISRASRETDELAQRMAADSERFEDYDLDQAYRILAAELLVKAAVAKENEYSKEGITASKLDDILKEAGQVLGLTKVADDKSSFKGAVKKVFTDVLNNYKWSPRSGWGQALYSAIDHNQLNDLLEKIYLNGFSQKLLDALRLKTKANIEREMSKLVEEGRVQKAVDSQSQKLIHKPVNEDAMEEHWAGWVYGEVMTTLYDVKNPEKKKKPKEKPTANTWQNQVKLYREKYAAPLRDIIIPLMYEVKSAYRNKGKRDKVTTWAKAIIEADEHVKFLDGKSEDFLKNFFSQDKNKVNNVNIMTWIAAISKIWGHEWGVWKSLNHLQAGLNKLLSKLNKTSSLKTSHLEKKAETEEQAKKRISNAIEAAGGDPSQGVQPSDSDQVKSLKGDLAAIKAKEQKRDWGAGDEEEKPTPKTPGRYDGAGKDVVAMQRKLHELSKLLKSKKYENAKAVGDTRGFGGWAGGTDSALDAAQEAMKVYKVSGALKKSPKSDVTAKENLELLNQLQKAVESGKPASKQGEAVKIKVNRTDVSLTESDLDNLSTLLDALSLQGVNFGSTGTRVKPTESPKPKPMVGGRPIQTEL